MWRTGTSAYSAYEQSISSYDFLTTARVGFPFGEEFGMTTSRENRKIIADIAFTTPELVDRAVSDGITIGDHRLLGSRPLPIRQGHQS